MSVLLTLQWPRPVQIHHRWTYLFLAHQLSPENPLWQSTAQELTSDREGGGERERERESSR